MSRTKKAAAGLLEPPPATKEARPAAWLIWLTFPLHAPKRWAGAPEPKPPQRCATEGRFTDEGAANRRCVALNLDRFNRSLAHANYEVLPEGKTP